jgi:hypothetical protein
MARAKGGMMDDTIIVKYVRVDGQTFENPLPKFEYHVKTGQWTIVIESGKHAEFFAARQEQEVEVEVAMQLGTLRDVGRVKIWQSAMPGAPSFCAKIEGTDPMRFVER